MSDIDRLLNALRDDIGKPSEEDSTNETADLTKFEKDPIFATIEQLVGNILHNKKALEEARALAVATGEAGYLESFSSVSKANTENLKVLSMIVTEQEKLKQERFLKEKELELKTKEQELKKTLTEMNISSKEKIASEKIAISGSKNDKNAVLLQQNNAFISANRETIFDFICGNALEKEKARQRILEDNSHEDNITGSSEIINI